jgi:hypothetical protein
MHHVVVEVPMANDTRALPPGPGGYFIAALLNVAGLVLINLHDWWRPLTDGIVTERFAEVVWAANVGAATKILGNLVLMRWPTRAPRAAMNVLFAATGLLGVVVTLRVFPFDLSRFPAVVTPGLHVALVLAGLATGLAMAVNLVRLVAAGARRVRATHHQGVLKARVVYESMFGNTRDVALAVAKGMRRVANVEVEVTEVDAADAKARCDLLVLGGPVHAWSMTRTFTRTGARQDAVKAGREVVSHGIGVREFLSKLDGTDAALAATFDTAASTKWFPVGSAARPAARALDELGYSLVTRPEHFYVAEKLGPLLDGELARAEAWGRCTAHAPGGATLAPAG